MGGPPAVIIVSRHGARLDAADEQWQSNSQTPYDSPLSYGGWTQTRALGARIASLLHARNAAIADEIERSQRRRQSDASTSSNGNGQSQGLGSPPSKSKRKQKVVIHTSPFLRCVQSSIAISAGMAQYYGNLVRLQAPPRALDTPKALAAPSRAQTLDSKTFKDKYAGSKPQNSLGSTPSEQHDEDDIPEFDRPTLRIDACLGEWLSPDYYDFTTAPPPSNMMVALAKAELIHAAEPLQGAKIYEPDGSVTEFPSGAVKGSSVRHERPRSATISIDQLARAVSNHDLSSVTSNLSDHDVKDKHSSAPTIPAKPAYAGYIPPTPTYAMLHSAAIPQGYTAHARDACIDIDFQWDSMRDPQLWGDGGSFGEEWSAMHRRFRGGLTSMVNWYKEKEPDFDPQDDEKLTDDNTEEEDDDTDVILVIMTHGAGCNALLGALTSQPVLMDVGMGSLTMAVRKPSTTNTHLSGDLRRNRSTSIRRRRRSSAVDLGLSEDYEMKLMASTEHLRAGPDPLVIPQLAHPGAMPAIPEVAGRGSTASPATRTNSTQSFEQLPSRNSSLGSMRRTNVKSLTSRNFSPSPALASPTSSGLWASRASTIDKVEEERTANFESKEPTTSGASESSGTAVRHNSVGGTPSPRTPGVTLGVSPGASPGLWGTDPPKEDTRRRYTVGMRR